MRCKYCGEQIVSNAALIEWRLNSPDRYGNKYLCSESARKVLHRRGHQPEEKSNNFKLIYDILNETD